METLLRLKAAKSGQDVATHLLQLVESDLDVDLSEHEGLEDFNAGNSISFEEWCAREAERKEERRRQKPNTRNAEKVA